MFIAVFCSMVGAIFHIRGGSQIALTPGGGGGVWKTQSVNVICVNPLTGCSKIVPPTFRIKACER